MAHCVARGHVLVRVSLRHVLDCDMMLDTHHWMKAFKLPAMNWRLIISTGARRPSAGYHTRVSIAFHRVYNKLKAQQTCKCPSQPARCAILRRTRRMFEQQQAQQHCHIRSRCIAQSYNGASPRQSFATDGSVLTYVRIYGTKLPCGRSISAMLDAEASSSSNLRTAPVGPSAKAT